MLKACDEVCGYKKTGYVMQIRGGGIVGQRMRYKRKYKEMTKIPLKKQKMNTGD